MNLGIFLAIGESLSDLQSKGQLNRLIDHNVKYYLKSFQRVYIFTYNDENISLPVGCILVKNERKLHRYIYSFLIPFIHKKEIANCHVFRGLQITGGIPGVIVKLLYKKNFIVNFGYNYREFAKIEGKFTQQIFFPILSKFIQKFAYRIIITSKFLRKYVDAKKSVLIPNGVDLGLFKPKQKKGKNLIFVGRLVKQKNLMILLKALEGLNDFKLFIVGDGEEFNNLKKLSKKLKINPKFFGVVKYNKLPAIYNKAPVFVLPSIQEGNPKSLLEAMSCGCVPIGTDVIGINNIIKNKHNGLLVKPDSDSLRKAIISIFNKPMVLKQYSKNARKYIEENYDINKLLSKEVNLLKKAAK